MTFNWRRVRWIMRLRVWLTRMRGQAQVKVETFAWRSTYLPWDVAAETGEWTHIIKLTPSITLSHTEARSLS